MLAHIRFLEASAWLGCSRFVQLVVENENTTLF
jgi:hypothetical protein